MNKQKNGQYIYYYEIGRAMTLVKKTVILTKNGVKGYITVVRVGSSSGIKAH